MDRSFKKKFLKFLLVEDALGLKGPIKGIGAPTPNFDPYASSYNHIFIQNTRKLHFLCQARLVGNEYVEENF